MEVPPPRFKNGLTSLMSAVFIVTPEVSFMVTSAITSLSDGYVGAVGEAC